MPPRSQPPSGDSGRAPRRRSIPAIARSERRVIAFEPRLALSASPGADLLLDAWGALHSNDFDAVSAESFCRPASGPAIPLTPQLWPAPQTNASDSSVPADDDSSPLPPLIAQAAAVRSSYGLTGAGQTVAVIDSGIAWDHVALGQGFGPGYRVVGGWDFAEADANPYDDAPAGFHGTHVAGLIGGQSESLSGIAPGADLVALRVFDDAGQGSLDWIESALQWVHDNRHAFESPITTVNISLGALLPEGLAAEIQAQLEDELQQLRDDAIVVVAAAGNAFDAAFSQRLAYPASSPHTWAVGSVDADGGLSQFSQRGEAILATVGRGVESSVPDHVLGWDGEVNDYHAANGTSMAAPQIAAASVLLRQAIEQTGGTATLDELLERLQQTAERRVDPVSGVTYYQPNLSAAIASVLGNPAETQFPGEAGSAPQPISEPDPAEPTSTPADPLKPVLVDLGRVQWSEENLTSAATLQATAVRGGWFSVALEADAAHPAVRISDAAGNILWDAVPPPSGQIDIPVVADQTLLISLPNATSGPIAVRLANVLGLSQGQLDVTTGVSDPSVALDLREGVVAQIGSLRYVFAPGQVTSGVIDGGSGADQLQITSSEAAARLVLNPYGESTLSEGGVSFALRRFEDVRFDGGGGADRAYLYDTRGNDRLEASPGAATLEGAGFRYEVSAVQRVYVHATAGGSDMAFLQDSAQDDRLAVRPQFVSLRGGDFFNSAYGFERVYAYATSGGDDVADLYDSAGDDRMTASAESAWISGPGYYVQARNFDAVTGHATAGGNDLATLYAESSSAGRWHHNSDLTALRTDEGASRAARGFERVETYAAGAPVRSLGGLLAAGETASEGPAEGEQEAAALQGIWGGWGGRGLLSQTSQELAPGVEDWRLRELLEAAAPLSAASLESSVASIAIPTSGGGAAERRLLEELFAEFGSEFDDAPEDGTVG